MLERIGGNYNKETHKTSFFKHIWNTCLRRYDFVNKKIADPFARNCELADMTNDLNKDTKAQYNLDAIEFLKMIESRTIGAIILDPPFSKYQDDKHYKTEASIYTRPGYVSDLMYEIERVLEPGGMLLKFGYNTNQHKHHFELKHLWVVHHGGNINDTLVSLWRKNNHNLGEWTL